MTSKSPKTKWRGRGPRALAAVLPKAAEPALRKRGFSAVEVITHWPEIVGVELAAETSPEKLSFPRDARSNGTLHLTATGSVALELQHLEPIIIERINTYFGYGAVARIALKQGAARKAPATKPKPEKASVSPDRIAEINHHTDQVGPEPLRDALRKLGTAVASAQVRPQKDK
ncbi:MAG: DUF721 domain-containing protein [Rhodospirillaceae bacterium]|nr:DUF721 domain-containing protein [Rhodospirillaceae bacterium]MBT5457540.1 DUF721 domain-containing protein [Rhodospirillaceae bacterium]